RKLRTRAEDYLRKPIAVDALVEKIGALLPLDPLALDDTPEPISMAEVDVALEPDDPEPTDMLSREQVDAEIDAFADSAFDSLMLDGGEDDATTIGVIPPGVAQAVATQAEPP